MGLWNFVTVQSLTPNHTSAFALHLNITPARPCTSTVSVIKLQVSVTAVRVSELESGRPAFLFSPSNPCDGADGFCADRGNHAKNCRCCQTSCTCPGTPETLLHFACTCPQFREARTAAHNRVRHRLYSSLTTLLSKSWTILEETPMSQTGLLHDILI